MAIHSNVLAWRIPWTEEPGRLQGTVRGVTKNQTRRSKLMLSCFQRSERKGGRWRRWGKGPHTAAGAGDLGCSRLTPKGGSGPFLPGSLLCPTLCAPSPVGGWMSQAEGGTVPGKGPGVRPCTGSDSQRPPTVPPGRSLAGEGGHRRLAVAPLPASGKRQNWGNRKRWESEGSQPAAHGRSQAKHRPRRPPPAPAGVSDS